MSFFSNTVKLIKNRQHHDNNDQDVSNLELDFSLRNYARESFSVLIVKPLSNYFIKFMRITTFVITGGLIGALFSIITFFIFMQFGSLESKFLTMFIDSHISQLFPDSDLYIKSAKLSWNSEKHSPEIAIKKLKLDDIVIPSISIFPNIYQSLKEQKLISDGINIISPKIKVKCSDSFKIAYFDPNFERNYDKNCLNESVFVLKGLKKLISSFNDVKVTNADVTIEENGVLWQLNNAYCHHIMGQDLPSAVSFKIKLPNQDYFSSFNIMKSKVGSKEKYILNIDSCNPQNLKTILSKRNTPINNPIINSLLDNSLPVSGIVHFEKDKDNLITGDFDLIGGAGSIKIPAKTSLSLNLGKCIDNGTISGTFSQDSININSLNINYGDASIQLTGITIPMLEYNLMEVANIDGTLSLTNIGMEEMASLLPDNFSKSIIPSFKNYMPGFKLGLFKVDLKGAIPFGKRNITDPLSVGNGVFKLSEAKVPLGSTIIEDVEAIGAITPDGFDIKLSKARLNKTIINKGEFFISSLDNSWIGTINADVDSQEVQIYASDISKKLGSLKINNLSIADKANIDMKLVKIEGDNLTNKNLPFRIIEGNGTLKSADNAKQVKFSWNDKELNVTGEANDGTHDISIALEENFEKSEGTAEFKFKSESNFLKGLIPGIEKIFSGNYALNLNMGWKNGITQYEVNMDLNNALVNFPLIGDIKLKNVPGTLQASIISNGDVIDISKFSIKTDTNNISGNVVLNKDGTLYKAAFNDFIIEDNNAKINLIRTDQNTLSVSFIGKRLNTDITSKICNMVNNNESVLCYLNLEELMIENIFPIKNIKGSLNIKNGKITQGACYGVIGKDTTLALTAQPNTTSDDSIVSLSASDAGKFLKYFKISDSLNGGTLNIVLKNSIISDKSMSGAFEITDFIIKNDQLTRLISFSSMNGININDNYSVGFNFCLGSFVLANNTIKIENGKAIGPTVGISYSGTYNRLEDKLDIVGVSLLTSSIMSSRGTNGAYAAPYKLVGSISKPIISVKPLQFVTNDAISEVFGNMLPIISSDNYTAIEQATPIINEKEKDPFGNKAFDVQTTSVPLTSNTKSHKSKTKKIEKEKRFGVRINRGNN